MIALPVCYARFRVSLKLPGQLLFGTQNDRILKNTVKHDFCRTSYIYYRIPILFCVEATFTMRFRKIYLEISNICNLRCRFCPGTKRVPHALTEPEFSALLPKLRPYTEFLYFHLMGEPLCHPLLPQFLHLAGQAGFKVILTTNGTLLAQQKDILLSAPALHKLNISLHAFEANDIPIPFTRYLDECFTFGKLAEGRKIISYRLWNQGGANM